MRHEGQVLLIDADDTLWENNVYFERAIEGFYELVAPGATDRTAVREHINQEERKVIAEMGYGLASFRVALSRAFQIVAPQRWNAAAAAAVEALAQRIAGEGIEFLPDAIETLRYLAPRHRLRLLTKGDFAEQSRKVELSGVRTWFEHVEVVPEKDETVYRAQLAQVGMPAEHCWMVGNSPKSDINPALAAGMNAVFIPHPQTWVLEHDEIVVCGQGRCLELPAFRDLQVHF
ncbi:MAG TPA: HAD family hydrolase [Terriglobales bacterium]|nr:HAD family hydrolase [Terriglobales bacterium]